MTKRSSEDEFIARQERDRAQQSEIKRTQAEEQARRKSHFMKCPKCGADLSVEHFREVEIDRCGECQGVWLDAGELEKLAGGESPLFRGMMDFFLKRDAEDAKD